MKVSPSVLGQFLHMKTHLPGLVDSGEHAGSHARVIMIGGGTDQSDLMAQILEVGEILKGGQMGMSSTNKNQVFTHRKHHPLSSSVQWDPNNMMRTKQRALSDGCIVTRKPKDNQSFAY